MSFKIIAFGVFFGVIGFLLWTGHNRATTYEEAQETIKVLGAGKAVEADAETALPKGMTMKEACFMLRQKYKIDSSQALGRQSRSVRHHWKTLGCGSLTLMDYLDLMQAQGSSERERGTSLMGRKQGELGGTKPVTNLLRHQDNPKVKDNMVGGRKDETTPTTSDASNRKECERMMRSYHVRVGESWGSLPASKQQLWNSLDCDDVAMELTKGPTTEQSAAAENKVSAKASSYISESVDAESTPVKKLSKSKLSKLLKGGLDVTGQAGGTGAASDELSSSNSAAASSSSSSGGERKGGDGAVALPSVTTENVEWCTSRKKQFKVIPMKSWGSLPESSISQWKARSCDLVFTAARMGKKAVTICDASNLDSSLPLISVLAASTTRRISNPSTAKLALFTYLLPSLIRTVDCGFRYEYVLGYDKGDPFYDSSEGMAHMERWFREHIEEPMRKNGVLISFRKVKVNNTLKKPGPVFLEMARAAYKAGADYMYRVNDDTEMLGNWPKIFVKALNGVEPKGLAVVGPTCNQGNQKILTHDFVSRNHMDIFGMNYYPPELTDWWMDDWISFVYGKQRTFKAAAVKVIHHTGAHGQRYEVDKSHEKMLGSLLANGRKSIRSFMLKAKATDRQLKSYDTDKYRAESFIHLNVPA